MPLPPGCRVLVVEDESLVAMHVEDMLVDLGCEVLLAMRLEDGLRLAAEADLYVAVLDVNLSEGRSYPIADVLRDRRIPFLFATGYGLKGVEPAYQGTPTLQKPYRNEDLVCLITGLLAGAEADGVRRTSCEDSSDKRR